MGIGHRPVAQVMKTRAKQCLLDVTEPLYPFRNSQQLLLTQNLHKVEPLNSLTRSGEELTRAPSLTRELLAVDGFRRRVTFL